MASRFKKIVYIDSFKNVNYIGTLEEFKTYMQDPPDGRTMVNMCEFLKKYRVTENGVFARERQKFVISNAEHEEDDSIYSLLKLGGITAATDYNNYISLLREYIREFRPSKLKVGPLNFTRSGFLREIEDVVCNFCMVRFGQSENSLFSDYRSKALLVKSLCEREIFTDYYGDAGDRIGRLLDLLGDDLNIKSYCELLGYDRAMFYINGGPKRMSEYIVELIGDDENINRISFALSNDIIVNSCFKDGKYRSKIGSAAAEYQKAFEKFQSALSN